ncbi:MAG: amidohydrolase family protein [Actinomycetota bacterium]
MTRGPGLVPQSCPLLRAGRGLRIAVRSLGEEVRVFAFCHALGEGSGPKAARRSRGGGRTVDVHCHVATFECEPLVADLYRSELEPYDHFLGPRSVAHNKELFRALRPKLTDPAERLRDMDRMGIEVQAIATFVSQYYYWTPPDLGAELARMQNDRLAEIVAAHPHRFVALGTLPLQHTGRALAELDRIMGLGFRGVQIGANVNGLDLDDPSLRPVFARAAELGAPVLIHPSGFTGGERLADFFLINVVGNPLDTTVALSRLILAGVLAEHPGLRLISVHGGGYLASYSDRLDHAWEVRPEVGEHITEAPSAYLHRQVYVDTTVFDPTALGYLVSRMGADHVLLGTDYPFDMGEPDPVGLIASVPGLSRGDAALIRGGNAARLLRLE